MGTGERRLVDSFWDLRDNAGFTWFGEPDAPLGTGVRRPRRRPAGK